jgi:two-component system LytT family response regulator
MRRSLKKLGEQLDPARFLRIHRSTIVNVDRVRELQPLFHGEYAVILKDGTELTSSRGLKRMLAQRFDV